MLLHMNRNVINHCSCNVSPLLPSTLTHCLYCYTVYTTTVYIMTPLTLLHCLYYYCLYYYTVYIVTLFTLPLSTWLHGCIVTLFTLPRSTLLHYLHIQFYISQLIVTLSTLLHYHCLHCCTVSNNCYTVYIVTLSPLNVTLFALSPCLPRLSPGGSVPTPWTTCWWLCWWRHLDWWRQLGSPTPYGCLKKT